MGADLLGFMLKGPKELSVSAETILAAVTEAKQIVALALRYEEENEADNPDDALLDELAGKINETALDDIDNTMYVSGYSDEDIEVFVAEFVELWPTFGYRDVTWRTFSDGTACVFAGEMSWGDEPEGTGYVTLRDAYFLGILPFLGIE